MAIRQSHTCDCLAIPTALELPLRFWRSFGNFEFKHTSRQPSVSIVDLAKLIPKPVRRKRGRLLRHNSCLSQACAESGECQASKVSRATTPLTRLLTFSAVRVQGLTPMRANQRKPVKNHR